jgi:5-formyltetrahydrofolate cyclo-ligase
MTGHSDDGGPATYASPPCFMHEVDPAYMGLSKASDPRQRADVMRWRKAERERLIAARLAIPGDLRRRNGERIAASLEEAIRRYREANRQRLLAVPRRAGPARVPRPR